MAPHRRALLLMGAYGFACGLPLPLSGFTLRQWMAEGHVSLVAIGLTANIGLPYSLKFLWAPLLDQAPPGLARLGVRRGWLLLIQPLLALACAALALGSPATPGRLALAAAAVAFLSASQDIAVDAWRIEFFPERMQGIALAAYVWGYRAALLVAGAGTIGLAGVLGWHRALLLVALLVLVAGAGTTALAGEPVARARGAALGLAARLRAAVVEPFQEFIRRPGAPWVLAFVMLFKLGEALAGTMAPPFYRAMGFDRAQVALATGVPGLCASLAAAALGGWLVARIGTGRALVLTGFVQMASQGLYFALAASGGDGRVLVAKVVLENVAEGMADVAFISYLSGLCASRFTATQYALLSSLAAVGLRTLGGLSGWLAQALGWEAFYGLTIFAALPAMLIMVRLLRRGRLATGM
jgi:PAT family beta-lactamase induction signal transducer AmpG